MPVMPGMSLDNLGDGRLAISSSTGGAVPVGIQSTIIMTNSADGGLATQAMAQAINPDFVAGAAVSHSNPEIEASPDQFGFS